MALASSFAVLVNDNNLKPATDEGLDLLTPNQRIQKARKRGATIWDVDKAAAAQAKVHAEEQEADDLDKRAKERKKWAELARRGQKEEERQRNFGRYSAGSLYFFGPEPDIDKHRVAKTLRQRFIRLAHWPWFERLVLAVTVVYIVLVAGLSNKICESWLEGKGRDDWDGEAGILKTFYPLTHCSENETRVRETLLQVVDYLVTLVFTAEFVVKVVAFGFVLHPYAYLRSGWTVFELVMLLLAWSQFLPGVPRLIIVRLFIVLRPLQASSRIPGVRPVVQTLIKGARPLGSVVLLCFFLIFFVGLISIEVFAGGMRGRCFHDDGSLARYGEPFDATVSSRLQNAHGKPILCNPGLRGFGKLFVKDKSCPPSQTCSIYTDPLCMLLEKESSTGVPRTQEEVESTPALCEYNENPDPTFSMDTIGRAMMTITRTLMLDNWAQTMRFLQAGFSSDVSLFIFIVLIFLGSWFVTNLAIAVVKETYTWELKVDTMATQSQALVHRDNIGLVMRVQIWLGIRILHLSAFAHARLVKYRPYRKAVGMIGRGDSTRRRVKVFRRIMRAITSHSLFDNFIMFVIIANTVTMCINYFDQSLFESNLCGALSLKIYGQRNCTAPLATFSRTSVISVPAASSNGSIIHASKLINTRGFCASVSNSSAVCFDTWDVITQNNVTMESICAAGACQGMPDNLGATVEVFNSVFTVIYVAEMVLKIIGQGLADYTNSWSNVFDAFIAITSLVDMFTVSANSGVGALRSFRVLRITRIFKRVPALQALMAVVVKALPRAVPLIFLLVMFLFTASEVGAQLVGGVLHQAVCEGVGGSGGSAGCIDMIPRTNFDTLLPTKEGYGGMITVLAMITGQRWSDVVAVAEAAGRGTAVLIFSVIVMIFGVYLILSLSLAIFVRTYVEVHQEIRNAKSALLQSKDTNSKLQRVVKGIGIVHAMQTFKASQPAHASHEQERRKSSVVGIPNEQSVSFDAVWPEEDGGHGQRSHRRPRSLKALATALQEVLIRSAEKALLIGKEAHAKAKAVPAEIRAYANILWDGLVDRLPMARIERMQEVLRPTRQRLADIVNSSPFVTLITICIIISTTVLLSDDPLGPMTECCPATFAMETNSSIFFGDRFCVRGDDVDRTCQGHGTCASNGLCQCDIRPEIFTGDKCQCKYFGSDVCGVGWNFMRHSSSFYTFSFLNNLFLTIFAAEMAAKWFAYGIIFPTGVIENPGGTLQAAYVRDAWNVIDGFVVVISLLSAFAGNSDLNGLKGLRTVRCLRPLRMIRRFPGLKALVDCLIQCLPHVARVFGVLLIIMGIFAILGLQLFGGKFHRCMDPTGYPLRPVPTQVFFPVNQVIVADLFECMEYGGIWEAPRGTFDNIFEALISMLLLATRDGWVSLMDLAVDSTSIGYSPLRMNQPGFAIFFLFYVLLLYCFLFHCLLAAVLEEYIEIKELAGKGFLSPQQLAWLERVKQAWQPHLDEKASDSSPKFWVLLKAGFSSCFAGLSACLLRLTSKTPRKMDSLNASGLPSEARAQDDDVQGVGKGTSAGSVDDPNHVDLAEIPDAKSVGPAVVPPGAAPSWARTMVPQFQAQEGEPSGADEKHVAVREGRRPFEDSMDDLSGSNDTLDRLKSVVSVYNMRLASAYTTFSSKFKRFFTPQKGSNAALWLERAQPYVDALKVYWARFVVNAKIAWAFATLWSVIIVNMRLFKIGIDFCIAINVLLMSLRSFPADPVTHATVDAFDTLFTVIFFIEMIMKILAHGTKKYLSSGWNVFDGIIAILCMFAVLIEAMTGTILPAVTVLRGFRVLRVLRLVRSAEALKTILFTLMLSFPAVANVAMLMLLFFLIYASLGVPLFYNVRWAEEFTGGINSFTNFQGFNSAFATLFTISTGDGWVGLMHSTFFDDPDYSCELDVNLDNIYTDETGCGSKVAGLLYFISFFVLQNYVVLNLIIVVVVDSFSVAQESGVRSSEMDKTVDAFSVAWRRLDPDLTGYIKIRELRDLILDWNPSQGDVRSYVQLLRQSSRYMTWKWHKGPHGWTRLVSLDAAFYAIWRAQSPNAGLPPSPMLSTSLRQAYRTSKRKDFSYAERRNWSFKQVQNHAARIIQYAMTVFSENVRIMATVRSENELDAIEIKRNSWIQAALQGGTAALLRAVRVWYRMRTRRVLRFNTSEFWGSVELHLVQGKNLPETTRAGKCDAFVTVSCGPSSRHRSNVAIDTYDPVWLESFAYDVRGTADSVEMQVWDDDVVANRLIGECNVPVSKICFEHGMRSRRWYELSGPDGNPKGNLELGLAVETYKWSVDVAVIECRGLPSAFIRESPAEEMNPYCCVVLGHKALATTPRNGTFSPVFKEKLHFDLADMNEEIRVVVLNNKPENESGDEFVAQAKVNAAQLLHLDHLAVNYWSGRRQPGLWDLSLWLPLVAEDGMQPWGQLRITCVEARGLPKMDAFGKVDPFCVVRTVRPDGPQDLRGLKTSVKIAIFEPKWQEDFTFDVMHSDSLVVVEIYDHDWGGDAQLIGVVKLPLEKMAGIDPLDAWHEIQRAEQGGSSAIEGSLGQIRLITCVSRDYDSRGSFGYVHLKVTAQLLTGVPTLLDMGEESMRAIGAMLDDPADLVDGHLHVAVMEAKDLPNMGGIEGVEAYCEVTVVGAHVKFHDKTRVEQSRNEVQWCDEFTVKRLEREADLSVVVREPDKATIGGEIGRFDINIKDLLAMVELARMKSASSASDGLPGEETGALDKWFNLSGGSGSIRLVVSLGPREGGNEYDDMDQFVTRGLLREILDKDAERIRQEERSKAVRMALASHVSNMSQALSLPFKAPPPVPEGGGLRILSSHRGKVVLQTPVSGLKQAGVGRTSRETPLRSYGIRPQLADHPQPPPKEG